MQRGGPGQQVDAERRFEEIERGWARGDRQHEHNGPQEGEQGPAGYEHPRQPFLGSRVYRLTSRGFRHEGVRVGQVRFTRLYDGRMDWPPSGIGGP